MLASGELLIILPGLEQKDGHKSVPPGCNIDYFIFLALDHEFASGLDHVYGILPSSTSYIGTVAGRKARFTWL